MLVHKLMLLFKKPQDVAAFETEWSERFVVLAERMPGIRRIAVIRVTGGPEGGADLHMIHEFYFDNSDALESAMISPEGQAAGKVLMSFASANVEILFAEHMEEDRT
jgi:uncharacterized protein (TIGR02118 family)